MASDIPPTPHPWRIVPHAGERYRVRDVDGVVWVSRISDEACWFYDPASTAPAWVRGEPIPVAGTQSDLFG